MRPIPVAFHLGPLEIHTYGIGLALTFWFAYRYFERRLSARGYRTDWLVALFVWVVVAAVVGARALHVLATLSYYQAHPADVVAVWQGGLSSFGGLILAVPAGIAVARRRCPELPISRALDLVAPVLAAAWSLGRILGPQMMVAGGGHATRQWFGMYYATQVGRRIPVPVIQSIEDCSIFVVLILLERRLSTRPDGTPRTGYPAGAVIGTGMVLWGIERTVDQRLWLSYPGQLGSTLVQIGGMALVVAGLVVLVVARRRWKRWLAAPESGVAVDAAVE
jgi:phosphatidylglycerol:prolipoprotein diacylglycerol transferase